MPTAVLISDSVVPALCLWSRREAQPSLDIAAEAHRQQPDRPTATCFGGTSGRDLSTGGRRSSSGDHRGLSTAYGSASPDDRAGGEVPDPQPLDLTNELCAIEDILSDMSSHSGITWRHMATLLGDGSVADQYTLAYAAEAGAESPVESEIAVAWPSGNAEPAGRETSDTAGFGSMARDYRGSGTGPYSSRVRMVTWQGHHKSAVPAGGGMKSTAPRGTSHGNFSSPYSFPATQSSPGALELGHQDGGQAAAAAARSGGMSTSDIAKSFADMTKLSQFRYLASEHSKQVMAAKDGSRGKHADRKSKRGGRKPSEGPAGGDHGELGQAGLSNDLRGRIHAAMAAARSVITIRNNIKSTVEASRRVEEGRDKQVLADGEGDQQAGGSSARRRSGKKSASKTQLSCSDTMEHQQGRQGDVDKAAKGTKEKAGSDDVAMIKSWQSLAEFKGNRGSAAPTAAALKPTNLNNVKIVRC